MQFNAKIKNRTLIFVNKNYLINFLREMEEEQLLVVDIEKRKKFRSNSQNAMYWGYILPEIANETGHTAEELHFFFKRMFLPKKFIKVGKKRLMAEPSTTRLSTKEFSEYVEKIIVWSAQELGIEWNL